MLNNDFGIIDKYDNLIVTIKPEKTVFAIPNVQEQIDLLDAAITGLDVSISGGNVQGVFVNLLNQLKADLLGGDVPTTLDTLKKLATKVTQLDTDKANVSEITAALSALESAIALRETILDNDVKLAAAQALDQIASSQVLILKYIEVNGLKTNGQAVANALHTQAESLRQQAEGDGVFEIIPGPWTNFSSEIREGI